MSAHGFMALVAVGVLIVLFALLAAGAFARIDELRDEREAEK